MKLLLFSDPHITPKAEFSKPTDDGLTDYLHRQLNSWKWVEQEVKDNGVDAVFCLGDLTETTGYVDTVSLSVLNRVVTSMADVVFEVTGRPFYILVGNHDIYSTEHNIHNLEFLKSHKKVKIIDEASSIEIGDSNICCIPWTDTPWEQLEVFLGSCFDPHVILTHLDMQGGLLFKDRKCEFGYDPKKLPAITFNGHQHNPHMEDGKFVNVGALLSRNFHDVDSSPRGIVTYDTENWSINRATNPHDIRFKDVMLIDLTADVWQTKLDNADTGLDSFFVRIKYEGKYKELAEQLSYLTMGARLEPLPPEVDVTNEHISEQFSPQDNFEQYVDQVFLFDEEEDKERILELGRGFIKRVQRDEDRQHTLPIIFKHVEIKNFHSIDNMEVNLNDQGVVFIGGVNGAGKSTIPEAIYWCLTGKSIRGYTGDEIIKWGESTCVVYVDLQIGDNLYRIERSRNPNRVKLFIDQDGRWSDIGCRLSKDTNVKVQKLVGRSQDVLMHSIFLSSDLRTCFTSLSYPDRVRLIEQITDSEIYSDIAKEIKQDLANKIVEENVTDRLRSNLKDSIKNSNERLLRVNGEINEAKRDRNETMLRLKSDLSDAIEQRDLAVISIKENLEQLAENTRLTEQVRLQQEDLRPGLDAASEKDKNWYNKVSYLKQSLQVSKKHVDAGECPTCGQSIGENAPISISYHKEIRDLEEATKRYNKISRIYTDMRKQMNQLTEQLSNLGKERITLMSFDKEASANAEKWRQAGEAAKASIQFIRSKTDELQGRRKEIILHIDLEKEKLVETNSKLAIIKRDKYALDWLFVSFGTKGIRARILSSVTVPFLNKQLELYSGQFGLPCVLTTQQETKGGDVQDKIDVVLSESMTYRGCSRGEKRKIDLAIQCALKDLAIATGGSHVNLLICDEVIDPLDDDGVANFLEVLNQKSDNMTVLLMSHKPQLENLFPSKWTLTKIDGTTRLNV